MRMVVATICLLIVTGCAHDLPYTIAIGDVNVGETGASEKPKPEESCVLRLDQLAVDIAKRYSESNPKWTVKMLQIEFEKALHGKTLALSNCKDEKGRTIKKEDYLWLENVSKKWLATYGLDATDPDQDIDRFREYLRSAQLVQGLAKEVVRPDETKSDTYLWVESVGRRQSQWCGDVTAEVTKEIGDLFSDSAPTTENNGSTESLCQRKRSLYHVETYPDGLYENLLEDTVQVERKGAQRSHRYFVLGYEIPWDKERTLVRYGVTFYFKQVASKDGTSASDSEQPTLIGYDLTYANEATPEHKGDVALEGRRWSIRGVTGWPFSLVIGVKNAAFELTKMPLSFMAGVLFGRDRLNYPVENFISAIRTLEVEVMQPPSWGVEWGWYRLILELPLVGQAFQFNFATDHAEPDVEQDKRASKIFLSRGIYGGNKWGQDTGLWSLFARESYSDYDVYSPPYRHGTVIDVVWSMFNLSHGPAYSEAQYVIDHANPDDHVYLAGHSGGVQRSAAASRVLAMHGYRVDKVVGIAGPSVGQAFVDTRYPDAFKVYLNRGSGANEDVVSKVGIVAGAYSTVLNYALVVPMKYAVGAPLFWVDLIDDTFLFSRRQIYRFFDRVGFSNATIVEVERKPSSRHQTPLRLSFTDRLVFDAYVRNEFAIAFKDDLERAGAEGKPKKERPHAFPWEQ